jgi:hypothetical protein
MPGRRQLCDICPLELLIAPGVLAAAPFPQELRLRRVGLADEDDVRAGIEVVLLDGDPWPANHDKATAPLEFGNDLAHAEALNRHACDAHNVRAGAAVVVNRSDVLINQLDPVLRRCERSQERQSGDRQVSFDTEQIERVLQPPEAGLELGIDQDDVCHRKHPCAGTANRQLTPHTADAGSCGPLPKAFEHSGLTGVAEEGVLGCEISDQLCQGLGC